MTELRVQLGREPPALATSSFQDDARTRLVTPAELADFLVVDRSYVYEHADELGAKRLGSGPRARLRFDLDEVRRLISCDVGRQSTGAKSATQAAKRPRRRLRSGTKAELLPIRGRSEAA